MTISQLIPGTWGLWAGGSRSDGLAPMTISQLIPGTWGLWAGGSRSDGLVPMTISQLISISVLCGGRGLRLRSEPIQGAISAAHRCAHCQGSWRRGGGVSGRCCAGLGGLSTPWTRIVVMLSPRFCVRPAWGTSPGFGFPSSSLALETPFLGGFGGSRRSPRFGRDGSGLNERDQPFDGRTAIFFLGAPRLGANG